MNCERLRPLVFVCGLMLCASPCVAQQPQEAESIRAEVSKLRQELDALEARLATLEGAAPAAAPQAPAQPAAPAQPEAPAQPAEPAPPAAPAQAAVPEGAAGAGGPQGAVPVYGNVSGASKVFNPDMAVIGNFLGASGSNKVNPSPALELHESEVSFQAVVDPYARADFFLAFGETGVAVEEGYATFPALPGGLLVKAGKMRAAFGKINTLHDHVLPWTDRPLVTDNLVGGDEGITDAGVSVARLIPNRLMFLEATGQVYRGDADEVFISTDRSHLLYVGHLRGYQDITESSNIDVGVSYAHGYNPSGIVGGVDFGKFTTGLFDVDATYRWRPLSRAIYRSFVGRTEVVWSRRNQPGGRQDSSGYFVSGDYQFARRWFLGGRYDHSGRANDSSLVDKGESAIVTYWPSEFSQVRGQYRRINYADGPTANELLFQLQFAIGVHGAHVF